MLQHPGPPLLGGPGKHHQPTAKAHHNQHPDAQPPTHDVAAVIAARTVLLAALQAQARCLLRDDPQGSTSMAPTGSGSRLGGHGSRRLASRPNPLNQLVSLFSAAHALQHPAAYTPACSATASTLRADGSSHNVQDAHNSHSSGLPREPAVTGGSLHAPPPTTATNAILDYTCQGPSGAHPDLAFPVRALLSTALGLDVVGPELMQRLVKTYASSTLAQGDASCASLGDLDQAVQHVYCGLRASRLLAQQLAGSCPQALAGPPREPAIAAEATGNHGQGREGGSTVGCGTASVARAAAQADEALVDLTAEPEEDWGPQCEEAAMGACEFETETEVVNGALRHLTNTPESMLKVLLASQLYPSSPRAVADVAGGSPRAVTGTQNGAAAAGAGPQPAVAAAGAGAQPAASRVGQGLEGRGEADTWLLQQLLPRDALCCSCAACCTVEARKGTVASAAARHSVGQPTHTFRAKGRGAAGSRERVAVGAWAVDGCRATVDRVGGPLGGGQAAEAAAGRHDAASCRLRAFLHPRESMACSSGSSGSGSGSAAPWPVCVGSKGGQEAGPGLAFQGPAPGGGVQGPAPRLGVQGPAPGPRVQGQGSGSDLPRAVPELDPRGELLVELLAVRLVLPLLPGWLERPAGACSRPAALPEVACEGARAAEGTCQGGRAVEGTYDGARAAELQPAWGKGGEARPLGGHSRPHQQQPQASEQPKLDEQQQQQQQQQQQWRWQQVEVGCSDSAAALLLRLLRCDARLWCRVHPCVLALLACAKQHPPPPQPLAVAPPSAPEVARITRKRPPPGSLRPLQHSSTTADPRPGWSFHQTGLVSEALRAPHQTPSAPQRYSQLPQRLTKEPLPVSMTVGSQAQRGASVGGDESDAAEGSGAQWQPPGGEAALCAGAHDGQAQWRGSVAGQQPARAGDGRARWQQLLYDSFVDLCLCLATHACGSEGDCAGSTHGSDLAGMCHLPAAAVQRLPGGEGVAAIPGQGSRCQGGVEGRASKAPRLDLAHGPLHQSRLYEGGDHHLLHSGLDQAVCHASRHEQGRGLGLGQANDQGLGQGRQGLDLEQGLGHPWLRWPGAEAAAPSPAPSNAPVSLLNASAASSISCCGPSCCLAGAYCPPGAVRQLEVWMAAASRCMAALGRDPADSIRDRLMSSP